MNPLNDYPAARKIAYLIQWVANGVLMVAGIVFATTGTSIDALPEWYVLTVAIAPALWTYLGITAQANVPSYRDVVEGDAPVPPPEGGYGTLETVILVLFALILLFVLLSFIR